MPRDWRLPDAMSDHAKPKKGHSDRPGEEHTTEIRRNVSKSVANASNHKVLEWGSLLNKWGSSTFRGEVSISNELIRNLNDCFNIRIYVSKAGMIDDWQASQRKGRAPSPQRRSLKILV